MVLSKKTLMWALHLSNKGWQTLAGQANFLFVISYLQIHHLLSLTDELKLPLFPAGCHFSPLNVSPRDFSFLFLNFWIYFHEIFRSSISCTVAVLVNVESSWQSTLLSFFCHWTPGSDCTGLFMLHTHRLTKARKKKPNWSLASQNIC